MTYLLSPTPAFPEDAEVQLDVGYEALMSAAATLLQRKIFCAPQFADRPDVAAPPLDAVANVLHLAAHRSDAQETAHNPDARYFFESITRLIVLYWPNSETTEIALGDAGRPPRALRQALAYILSKRGIVESSASVAKEAGTGLRRLEYMFSVWLGMGIARYAKMLRLKFLAEQWARTEADLASLAKVYRFSNLSRLRQDLSRLDPALVAEMEPESLYLRLLACAEGQGGNGSFLAEAICTKGTMNA
jgi:hypothetical protein